MKSAFVLSIFWAFVSVSALAQPWDFNDLSLLLPLPRSGEESLMLGPQAGSSAQKMLLPYEIYSALPGIVVGTSKEAVYQVLKVVAVRIDPCFAETFSSPCQKQIRFVWQPVVPSQSPKERSEFTTVDATIHTFHRLKDSEWAALLQGLLPLRQRYALGPGLPLQIHPYLRQQGYRGDYWQHWTSVVLPLVGPQNLVRVTAMTVNPRGNVWVFLGFDLAKGKMTRINIPRVDNISQAFMTALEDTSEFRTDMNPKPAGNEAYLHFLFDSLVMRKEGRQREIQEALRTALEIDNPGLQTTGTVDCASCHASRAVSHWAKAHFPQWNWARLFPREVFRGPGDLSNTSVRPLRTDILRSFGYFGSDPIISSRVINDTSVSAGQMMATERRFF